MKKSFINLTIALSIALTAGSSISMLNSQADDFEKTQDIEVKTAQEIKAEWDADITNNVGNGQEYAYSISHIDGENVYGIALNKKSSSNGGIFLYQDEIPFPVDEGDKIIVVWGEEEDEFETIAKAVKAENGAYVREYVSE